MLHLSDEVLRQIQAHGEQSYPEEGAGFLLGTDGAERVVQSILPLSNEREDAARHNRYLLSAGDYLKAELEAERRNLDLIGVFHSHPDHPNQPSEFDREWAQPFFSYIITSIHAGKAVDSRSWRLAEDRSKFTEEKIQTTR